MIGGDDEGLAEAGLSEDSLQFAGRLSMSLQLALKSNTGIAKIVYKRFASAGGNWGFNISELLTANAVIGR